MDEDVNPLMVERTESMFSSPLFRISKTTPLCDTGTVLTVLTLSRYWSWTRIRQTPADFNLRGDALSIISSYIFSASLAAIESHFIDRNLQATSKIRTIYSLVIGCFRWQSEGVVGAFFGNIIAGGGSSSSYFLPSYYLPARGAAYLAEACSDVLSFLWRLIRWKFGPDWLYLTFRPLALITYALTCAFLFVFDTQTPQHFLGWALLPNIEVDSQSAIALNTAILGLIVLLLFRRTFAILNLFARLPDVNRRNLERGARLLGSWRRRPVEENYTHRPLKKAREIRLLQLMPRNSFRPNVVRAELLTVSIEKAPEYECVSYTWGDLSKVCDSFILVEGKCFVCSPKVHDMLVDLTTSSERLLWIDWFCINQVDGGEKSSQVSLMRDIFRGAINVIAWLEPSHDVAPMRRVVREAEFLIRGQSKEQSGMQGGKKDGINIFLESMLMSRDEEEFIALLRFFKNNWFQRVWIIQEVALANGPPTIYYGKDIFEWNVLIDLARCLLGNELTLQLGELTAIERCELHHALHSAMIMNSLGSMVQKNQPIELSIALQECSSFSASFPPDKVFALMGFTGDTYHRGIQPDYSESVENVYKSTAQYLYSFLVSGSQSGFHSSYPLRILHMAGVGVERSIPDLPSWVPDWSVPYPSRILTRTEISQTELRQYRPSAAVQVSGGVFITDGTEVLRLRGVVVDVIKILGEPLEYRYVSPIANPYSAMIAGNKYIESVGSEKPPDFEHPEMQDYGKLFMWHSQAGMIRDDEVDDRYITGESAEEAFWLMLVGNTVSHPDKREQLDPQHELFRRFLDHGRHVLRQLEGKEAWGGYYMSDVLTKYKPTFIHTGRRFTVTEDDYMGLVPAGTQPGDLVCIILGAQTPFLLRPAAGGTYEIVGECYIHGMMDGEMVSDTLKAEWFDII